MFLEWLGPGLVLAAPHVFWRGLTAAYILPKLLLLGLGAACVGAAALKRRAQVPATALDLPLAALFAASVASALASVDPLLSVIGRHGGFSDGLWGLTAAACGWFAGSWLDERPRAALPRLALWAGGAAAAHAVLQHVGADPWKIGPLPSGRAVAGVGSPVDLGGYLALLFPLAVAAARDRQRPRRSGSWPRFTSRAWPPPGRVRPGWERRSAPQCSCGRRRPNCRAAAV